MRIDDGILNCSFHLYKDEAEAEESKARGGSGFFVGVPIESSPERFRVYPVTCRHIIEQGFCTARVNLRAGGTKVVLSDQDRWYCSPNNDVAVGKIPLLDEYQIKVVPIDLFATREWIEKERIGVGDGVYVVGRLLDNEYEEQNTPVARFGRLARTGTVMHPNPCLKKAVETFFCEVKSVGGFSGSPVFVEISALDDRNGNVHLDARRKGPRLLGVDWGHTKRREPVYEWSQDAAGEKDGDRSLDDYHVYRNSGVACVAPAWELLRILEEPEFLKI